MQTAEISRAAQRALLNSFFNGEPLWTEEEARQNRILIRFNDKAGAVLLHSARAQYENALMKQGVFFNVNLPDAPPEKQRDWGKFITLRINKPLMDSSIFYHTQDNVFGGVALHGVGAKVWWDDHRWLPTFTGVQDILLPTDTELTMQGYQYGAFRRKMRPGELFKKTFALKKKNIDPGWNLPAVRKILDNYKELNQNPNNWDWSNNPEQMTELYKQNMNYYDGDSAPIIWFWDFIYREEEGDNPGFYRRLVLDKDSAPSVSPDTAHNTFIYNSSRPMGSSLGQIVHFQFGDGNNVPPFMYHSIRSLAFLTYELLWTLNRLRCQWTQHVFEQMLTLFRITDPNDRSRLQQIVMDSPWGIIPEGLNMVPAGERYQVNADLVNGLQAQYKQLIGEATSSYTQKVDDGTQKERTKFEVQAMLSQISALMSSLLSRAYRQEHFSYSEIARRFTIKDSRDFDVKKFRAACITEGIPEKWIDSERWDIEVEQKLGGGNRMLELAEATQLMEKVELYDPEAQMQIKHLYTLAVTNNPKLAGRLAPSGQKTGSSDAVKQAEADFSLLIQGYPAIPKEGLNHIEQVETVLRLMEVGIRQIMQAGGVGTPEKILGLHMAAIYVQKHIEIIAQDKNEKARVKNYMDQLGKLMNEVRAMEQRQQAAAAQQNGNAGMPPEAQAKIATEMAKAHSSVQIKEAAAKQKRQHKEMDFAATQRRKNLETVANIQRGNAETLSELHRRAISAFQE